MFRVSCIQLKSNNSINDNLIKTEKLIKQAIIQKTDFILTPEASSLFSLDKNYYTYSIIVEQLKTEGWQYFQLSGKYNDSPDHETAFKFFCKSVENIKKKQIEQEFSGGKAGDKKTYDFDKEMKKNLDKFKIKDQIDDEKKKLIKDRKKKDKEDEEKTEVKLEKLDKIEEGDGPNIIGDIAE